MHLVVPIGGIPGTCIFGTDGGWIGLIDGILIVGVLIALSHTCL
jgi:hypothetical protein